MQDPHRGGVALGSKQYHDFDTDELAAVPRALNAWRAARDAFPPGESVCVMTTSLPNAHGMRALEEFFKEVGSKATKRLVFPSSLPVGAVAPKRCRNFVVHGDERHRKEVPKHHGSQFLPSTRRFE